jgi:hypothetical protein
VSGLIELTGFGDLLRLVGILFWVLVVGALIMALTLPKTRQGKALATLVVVGLFIAFPGRWAWEAKQQRDAVQARYQKADAMFQERCKKSGVFIYRTAENVEGIFLLKLRPKGINYGDQYKMDDPYGRDINGDGYIETFLRARKENLDLEAMKAGGYRYIDAIDLQDGKRYRYTGSIKEVTHTQSFSMGGDGKTQFKTMDFVLDKVLAPDPAPRYGVTYDDISTREERDYWIAGSSLKVIDLQTSEIMAERIGYMMDRGQGNNSGGRSPWLLAARYACPRYPGDSSAQIYQTRFFVEKVLHTVPEK